MIPTKHPFGIPPSLEIRIVLYEPLVIAELEDIVAKHVKDHGNISPAIVAAVQNGQTRKKLEALRISVIRWKEYLDTFRLFAADRCGQCARDSLSLRTLPVHASRKITQETREANRRKRAVIFARMDTHVDNCPDAEFRSTIEGLTCAPLLQDMQAAFAHERKDAPRPIRPIAQVFFNTPLFSRSFRC